MCDGTCMYYLEHDLDGVHCILQRNAVYTVTIMPGYSNFLGITHILDISFQILLAVNTRTNTAPQLAPTNSKTKTVYRKKYRSIAHVHVAKIYEAQMPCPINLRSIL